MLRPTPAAYANLRLVPPAAKPTAAQLKRDAHAQRTAETSVKQKVEQAHSVLCRLEARSACLALRIKELQRRKGAAERRDERIEDGVLAIMSADDLERLDGLRVAFTMRAATPALIVDDEALIPPEYLRETLVSAPDKHAIKAALSRGAAIAGVHLAQKVSLLRK